MDGTCASAARPEGILSRAQGAAIAYERVAGKNPGVVFLHGFRSDMTGGKALAVESFCRARGQAFVRFDVSGHGASGGAFTDGTIGSWAGDVVDVLDHLTEGPQILVGSSMGGWLMLLAALARPERIAGLLGIAAAPDFIEELMVPALSAEQKRQLLTQGLVEIDSGYDLPPLPLTRRLVDEARNHLLLSAPIALSCPVRLIHGMRDPDVPWDTALRLADSLISEDVEITLVKKGEHRLSEPEDIARMLGLLGGLLDRVQAGEARP